jgi:hypothetical protein
MSEYRVEKRRADAELTLSTGGRVTGAFFLAGSSAAHAGPELVGDLVNGDSGFFPFALTTGTVAETVLYNRAHVVMISLPPSTIEAQLDSAYGVATRCRVAMLLSTGVRVSGTVAIYGPAGHERLSDYAHTGEAFRYLETADRTLIINSSHIVQLTESAE